MATTVAIVTFKDAGDGATRLVTFGRLGKKRRPNGNVVLFALCPPALLRVRRSVQLARASARSACNQGLGIIIPAQLTLTRDLHVPSIITD